MKGLEIYGFSGEISLIKTLPNELILISCEQNDCQIFLKFFLLWVEIFWNFEILKFCPKKMTLLPTIRDVRVGLFVYAYLHEHELYPVLFRSQYFLISVIRGQNKYKEVETSEKKVDIWNVCDRDSKGFYISVNKLIETILYIWKKLLVLYRIRPWWNFLCPL